MKPHKHAELIKAWADGAEIEERYTSSDANRWHQFLGDWDDDEVEFRIKPEPKKEVWQLYEEIRKITDGASESMTHQDAVNEIMVWKHFYEKEYNFKPESKPDVVKYATTFMTSWHKEKPDTTDNLKLTFNGETGELKSAEVLK